MGISKRHHYIPQFLIKRFADNDGKLFLYNKETGRFAKARQSTKSVFFEMNRNTIELDGIPYDYLEQLYASMDTKFADVVTDLMDNRSTSVENIASMLILVSSLKWRLPANDDDFDSAVEALPYEKLPFEIKVKKDDGSDHTEAINHIVNSELFKQSKRIIFPFLPFYEGKDISPPKMLKAFHNSYVNYHDNYISILGDCPLIEDVNSSVTDYDNFILPISSNDTYICSDNGNQKVTSPLFYFNQDLAVFHQSEKYVVCKDRTHLEKVIQMYGIMQESNQADQIIKHIFKMT